MDLQESIAVLERGLSRIRCTGIPTYPTMLERLTESLTGDPDAYRGYRCRMQYAVYGWQIAMAFAPPAEPA